MATHIGGMDMRIAIGADHAGWPLKEGLVRFLMDRGWDVEDFGTFSDESVDYPDYAEKVGRAVASGQVERGLLICGTGIGMAISANKVTGVRAVIAHDVVSARLSREHNDANVLTMGARIVAAAMAEEVLGVWLDTEFSGGRPQRRIEKIQGLETTGF
jgi:ribose 5-phosphate isomerase B